MANDRWEYTTRIKQPQKVGKIELKPEGGTLTEREIKSLKKDAYGASLIEKGMLIIESAPASEKDTGETIPDFDSSNEDIEG